MFEYIKLLLFEAIFSAKKKRKRIALRKTISEQFIAHSVLGIIDKIDHLNHKKCGYLPVKIVGGFRVNHSSLSTAIDPVKRSYTALI